MTTREFSTPGWPRWADELADTLGILAHAEPVAGGDINEGWRIELVDGRRVFLKSHASPPPGMYAAEADGLAWLAAGPLRVPGVVAIGQSFLALEWLDLGSRGQAGASGPSFEERLGRGLAQLHQLGAPSLGHMRDNYLATLPQDNTPAADLPTFWIERRLRPVIAQLGDRGLLARLDPLAARPDRFGPPEPLARLHGDLWWGNVGNLHGEPVVFDPAVYGGHREIDLAMLALFGGLGDRLIGAYREVWPLADGWRGRLALWQLYPLACHAVLFGGGYVPQLARSLDAVAA
ncbi:MAG TPA: fructosamine kinase family protein [Kofleriaceae bacterium]|nr:fructosamine kinase family protein [Kofleriaceae bacterium]